MPDDRPPAVLPDRTLRGQLPDYPAPPLRVPPESPEFFYDLGKVPVPDVHEHFAERLPYASILHPRNQRVTANMLAPTTTKSEVLTLAEIVKRMHQQHETLASALGALGDHLAPCLAPDAPVPATEPVRPFAAQSPLGDTLLAHTYALLATTEQVQRLLGRLDTTR